MPSVPPFHLAFPVHDLPAAEQFYMDIIGCKKGRSSDHWIDFDFYGHQIVAHLDKNMGKAVQASNNVDSDVIPVPHFGVVLSMSQWRELRDRLIENQSIQWIVKPKIRFEGQPGEQATMFFKDPSGNALEFKAFEDMSNLFAI
jgi:extradiol dioxygenase family protein